MAFSPRSLRQEQREFSTALRERGQTWVEVASAFHQRYDVNMRAAMRLARDWSQREAATRWNRRWPNDPKTDKNISYWELWPALSGYCPSLDVLKRLAELYECGVADLLVDAPSYRSLDPAHRARTTELPHLPNGRRTPANMPDLIGRLDEMDVDELARTVSGWASASDPERGRRRLLKLAAGMALAAADPVFSAGGSASPHTHGGSAGGGVLDLTGIWHSRYDYESSAHGKNLEGEHYLVLRQQGDRLTGQSLPHTEDSRLHLDLSVTHGVATGTWRERTSPSGHYRGATYHGTLQMICNPMGRRLAGRWLGFGRDFRINSGDWELTWMDGSISSRTAREYHLKA